MQNSDRLYGHGTVDVPWSLDDVLWTSSSSDCNQLQSTDWSISNAIALCLVARSLAVIHAAFSSLI